MEIMPLLFFVAVPLAGPYLEARVVGERGSASGDASSGGGLKVRVRGCGLRVRSRCPSRPRRLCVGRLLVPDGVGRIVFLLPLDDEVVPCTAAEDLVHRWDTSRACSCAVRVVYAVYPLPLGDRTRRRGAECDRAVKRCICLGGMYSSTSTGPSGVDDVGLALRALSKREEGRYRCWCCGIVTVNFFINE